MSTSRELEELEKIAGLDGKTRRIVELALLADPRVIVAYGRAGDGTIPPCPRGRQQRKLWRSIYGKLEKQRRNEKSLP